MVAPLIGFAARLAARKLKTEILTPKNYNKYVKPLLRDKNLKYKDYRKRYPDVKGVQIRNNKLERVVNKKNIPFIEKNPQKILTTKQIKQKTKEDGGKIFRR